MREIICFVDSLIHDEAYCARDAAVFERRTREIQARATTFSIGERALHAAAGFAAPYLRKVIEHPYEEAGYTVLGAGFRSTAYRCGNEIHINKLHRGSIRMTDGEKERLLDSYRQRQHVTEYFLGRYALKQTFSIEPHPFKPGESAVVGQQEYINFQPLERNPQLLDDSLKQQLIQFITRSEEMVMSTGYFVDIGGTNNLVVTDDNLLLIDTIPCDPLFAPERVLSNAQRNLEDLHKLVE